jgi:hypothetical protein
MPAVVCKAPESSWNGKSRSVLMSAPAKKLGEFSDIYTAIRLVRIAAKTPLYYGTILFEEHGELGFRNFIDRFYYAFKDS